MKPVKHPGGGVMDTHNMNLKYLFRIAIGLLAAAPGPAPSPAWGLGLAGKEGLPCYIVIGTDVSSSMNENDPLIQDASGKRHALRNEAQLTFFRLLPFVHPKSYVGVVQFAESVTYCQPGKDAPAALIPWQDTQPGAEMLKKLVPPIEPQVHWGTLVPLGMGWGADRIRLARKAHGDGPGILILLTDGDPDNAGTELSGQTRQVTDAVAKLAAANIHVCPVIINKASYRAGRTPTELSPEEKAAESLMDLVAAKTGGKAYRITPTQRLLDIFIDILGSGPTHCPFTVSNHHRTVILIGSELESIEIDPFQKGPGTKPYSLRVEDGIDATSGVGRRVTPMAAWNIVILRRPAELGRLANHWCGQWRPLPKDRAGGYKGRAYLISDFLMHVDSVPASPGWAHEQIRVRARLAERPKEVGEGDFAVPPLEGKGISVQVTVSPAGGAAPIPVEAGQWDAAGTTYTSGPFQLSKVGSYQVGLDCVDHVGTAAIPLGRFQAAFDLRPSPVTLRLLSAETRKTVCEVPAPAAGSGKMPACQGGQQVIAELSPGNGIQAGELSGYLELEAVGGQKRPFGPDPSGRIVTAPITLPLGAKHLAGQAVAQVATPAGVRTVRLPKFRFLYDQPPPRLEQHFADRRNALWVGELHQQIVTVAVLPVFQESAPGVLASFPEELPEVTMHAFDAAGKKSQPVPVHCRREPGKAPRYTVEDGVPKVVASYRLESTAPLPAADHCLIDLGTVSGLRAEPRRYDVIDPAAKDVFAWQVFQDAASNGVAAELVPAEPIHFAAEWKADQHVAAVRFEVPCAAPDGPRVVRLPVPAAGTAARAETRLDGLEVGETYPVYVRVTCRPPESDSDMAIRLHAGQFHAERRRLRLEDWSVGAAPGADVRARPFEELEIPLHASFAGYVPNLPLHSRLIDAFKKSCKLTVSSGHGSAQDISGSIRWTSVQVPPARQGARAPCRFEGCARWTPERTGRADLQLSAEIGDGTGQVTTQTAYARAWVDDPRLVLRVTEVVPGGERTLYDLQSLVAGKEAVFPIKAALATQIRIGVRRAEDRADPQPSPWDARVQVLCLEGPNGRAEEVSDEALKLLPGGDGVKVEVTLSANGEYTVQLVTVGSEASAPKMKLVTPTLVELQGMDVPERRIPPSGFLTGSVRQWPFEYRVKIAPDWPVRAEAFQFQFKLPGSVDQWVDGVTGMEEDGDGKQWLIARSPEFMPRPKSLKQGDVQFRLRHKEVDRKTWTFQDLRVVGPVLQGLKYRSQPGDEARSLSADLELDAPVEPQFQPRLREASDLENWWKPGPICVYVVRNPGGSLEGTEATADELAQLSRRCGNDDPDVEVCTFSPEERADWKPAETIATEGSGFWGWPTWGGTTYAVLVSAAYGANPKGSPSAGTDGDATVQQQITEWSDVYRITVSRALPGVWWVVLALAAICGSVQLVRLAAPRPEGLGVDMRIFGGAAAVDPTRNGNRMFADVRRSIANEWAFNVRRTWRRWKARGKWGARVAPLAVLGTCAWLLAILLFWPGRRAWVAVRLSGNYRTFDEHMGVIGVWTVPFWKNTGWLSGTGSRTWQPLPRNGSAVNADIHLLFRIKKGDPQRSTKVRLQVKREGSRA